MLHNNAIYIFVIVLTQMINLDKLKQIYKFSKELSIEDASVLIKSAKNISFKKKEILIDEGSLKTTVFFIKKGIVRCYCINEKGEEITFGLVTENQIISNIDTILYDRPSNFYFEALEETKTFSIDYSIVENIIESNPKLQKNRKFFAQKMMKLQHERVKSFVLLNPEERYLDFIKKNPSLVNRVPGKYIANVLGITPVSLSRIRARVVNQKK